MDKFTRNVLKPTNKASHGITYEEYDDLHYKQQQGGEDIEKISGNKDHEYQFPKHEAHLFHVSLEERLHSQTDGRRLSKPRVIKFYPKFFKEMIDKNMFGGTTVIVLHDPTIKEEIKKPVMDVSQETANQALGNNVVENVETVSKKRGRPAKNVETKITE